MIFDLSTPLPSKEMKPTHRFEAEQFLVSRAPDIISQSLKDLPIDSWDTVGSLYFKDPLFYASLEKLISRQNKTFSKTSQDMRDFVIRYTLEFYPDLISLLISHDSPITPDYLSSLSTRNEEFTGLVIYAGASVPYHGHTEEALLQPALFPCVYDEDMNLVFDKTFVDPEFIKHWGMVQYDHHIPETFLETEERVGVKPFKISLREVFGKNRCDMIISKEDSELILSSTQYVNWLREGRILVILGR